MTLRAICFSFIIALFTVCVHSEVQLPLVGPHGETYVSLGGRLDHTITEDDRVVAVSSLGIFFWDIESGELLGQSQTFTEPALSAMFSDDGFAYVLFESKLMRFDLSGNLPNEPETFNTISGKKILSISDNSSYLVTQNEDFRIHVYQTGDIQEIDLTTISEIKAKKIWFSPNEKNMLIDYYNVDYSTGQTDSIIQLWSLDSHSMTSNLDSITRMNPIIGVSAYFSNDNNYLILSGHLGAPSIWNVNDGAFIQEIETPYQIIRNSNKDGFALIQNENQLIEVELPLFNQTIEFEFSENERFSSFGYIQEGERLAVAVVETVNETSNRKVVEFDSETAERLTETTLPPDYPSHISVLENPPRYQTSYSYGNLVIRSVTGDTVVMELDQFTQSSYHFDVNGLYPFVSNGEYYIRNERSNGISIYKSNSNELVKVIDLGEGIYSYRLRNLCISDDLNIVASQSRTSIQVYDVNQQIELLSLSEQDLGVDGIYSVKFNLSSNGRYLAIYERNQITIWDVFQNQQVKKLENINISLSWNSTTFSPNNSTHLFPLDRLLIEQPADSDQSQLFFLPTFSSVRALAFTPDAQYLVVLGLREFFVFDYELREYLYTIEMREIENEYYQRVAISQNGKYIAVQLTNRVLVYDLLEKTEVMEVPQYSSEPDSIAFYNEQNSLIVLYRDGNRVIWPLPEIQTPVDDWQLADY
ncbi:MAG: hypothetical protein P9L94_01575 [Candidatus Hinthialibacter antarcticus]|nr:hypothetical protein [Candidatus Hinthialibacter antarcticus]